MVDNGPSGGNRKIPDGENQKNPFMPPPDVDEDHDAEEDELETTTALQMDLRLSEKLGASDTKEFDGGDEEDEPESLSTDPTEVARQEKLGAQFVDVLTLSQLRSDLARVPEPDYAALGVNVRSQGGASLDEVGVFRFPDQVTQTRTERGIVNDFSASTGSPPEYNGEPIKSLSYLKGGEDELLVTTGSGTVRLGSAALAKFSPPALFGFTDSAGNSTTVFANGDRRIDHPDGSKTTQFGPIDQEGRLYRREYEEAGSKKSVTYFADGRRQLNFDPPRHDGAASIVEIPKQGYSRYDGTFVTKPADVPQKVEERARQLENARVSDNSKEALEAVKALAELELQSPEAKQALDKFAALSADNEGFVKYARFNQRGGPINVLLESGTMQSTQRMPLWRAAALDLSATAHGGMLTFEQATLAARGLAFVRHDGKAASGSDEVSMQFREALIDAVESPDRQATMKAVHNMICLGDLPTIQRLQLAEEFAPIYLRGLEAARRDGTALPSFKRQFQELSQELKSDNSAAAMVMAGIAARGIDFKQNGADSKSFAELAEERVKSVLPKLTETQLAAVGLPDSGKFGGAEFVSLQVAEEPEEPEDKSGAGDKPKVEDKPKVADQLKVEDRPVSPAVKNFDAKLAADLKRLDDAIKAAARDKTSESDRIGDLQTKAVMSFDAIGNNRAKLTKKADDPQLKTKETELARESTVLEVDQLRALALCPTRERDLRAYRACLLIASGKDAEVKDGEKQLVELIKDNPNLATDEKFHETVLKSFAEMAGMRKARGLGEWKSTLAVDDILGDRGKSDKKPEKAVGELVQKASESFFDNGIEKSRPLFDEANRAAEEEYVRAERARLSLFLTALKQDATIAQDGFVNKNIDESVKESMRLIERQKEAIENSREARLQAASVKSNFAFAKIASGEEKLFVEGKKELLRILEGDPTLAMNDEFKETCTNAFKAHHLNKPENAVATGDGAPKKEEKKEEKKEGDANQGDGPKFANKFAMPTVYNPSVTEDVTIKAYTADQFTDIGLTAALIGLGIYSMIRFRNARQRAREYAQSAEEFQNIGKLEATERGNLKGPEKTYSDVLQSYKELAEKYKSAKAQDNAKNTEDYVKALEKAAEATRKLEESIGKGEISPEKADHLRKFIKKEFAVTDLIPQPKPDEAKERPTVDPKLHIRGGRVEAPLSKDVARPCVFRPDKGKPDLVKGFAVEGKDGNAQVLKFSPEKAHDKGIPKEVTLKSGEHVLLHHAPGSGEAFYFERSSNQILRVDVSKDGPSPLTAEGKSAKAQVLETQPPINVPADRKSGLFPTTQQERSIELSGARGQTAGVWASRPGGGIVIGDGSRSDIVVGAGKPAAEGGRDMAHVFASQEGFFVTRTGDAPVNIRHEDGKVTELKAGETYVFKPKDTLLVNKEEIKLAESTRLAHTPGSFRAVSRDGGRSTQAPFDFASNTRCDAKMTPGFSYRDTMPTTDPVPTRVVDASIDPHLAAIEADVVKRFSHLKDKPEELFKELTKYVHEVGTPKQVEDGSSRVRYNQHDNMDAGSHLFNKAVGKEGSVLLGDVAARGNMVCVDQSMMLKYLSERMGLDVSVRSGTLDGQGHTWVEMKNGGKTVAGDPRNYNHLSESQRAGIEVDPATGQPKDATSLNLKPFEKVSERQGGNLLSSPADFAVLTRFLNSDTVGAAMRSVEGLAGIVGSGQLEAGRAKILLVESLRNLVRTEQYRTARDKPDVSRTAADRAVLLVVDKGREALDIEPSRWQAEVETVMSDVNSRPGDVVRAVTGEKVKPGERLFDPAQAMEASQPATLRIDGKDWVRNSRGQYENRHDTRAWERIEAYRQGGDTYVRSAAGETVIRADGSRVNVDNSGIRREFGADGKIQSATTADGTRVNYEYAKDGPNKGELLTVTASGGYKLEATGPQEYKVTQGGRTVERKGEASVDTTSGAIVERPTGSELARSRSLDGTVSEVRTGSDLSRVVEVNLNSQVDRINRLADFHMSEGRRMRFNDLMTRFAESGLPPLEKARVLEQAARLMEATGETALPQHDRVRLAEQMLFQFADIAQVSQGRNSTCTMGSMEVILSQRSPGDLAKMAADIGIKGKYVLANGTIYDATVIAGALHPDAEAAKFGAPDAARVASYHDLASHETHGQEVVRGTENLGIKNRSHLSQILQVGLANVQLSSEARTVETLIAQPWVQEQIKKAGLDPSTVKLQYGRLSDSASAGERIFMVDSTGKRAILNFKNGQPIDSPIVHTSDFPEIFKQVTGRYQDGLGIANVNMFPSDTRGIHTETRESMRATHRVDSPESLAKVLKQTTLPVEISVWTGNPPFSQREPGWHAMVVTGYDEKSGKVTLLDPKGKDAVIEVTLEQAYKLTDAPPENRNGFFSTADMTSIAGRPSADIRLSTALRDGGFDPATRRAFAEHAELFNQGAKDVTVEKLQRELLDPFIGGSEGLRSQEATRRMQLKAGHGSEVKLVFKTKVGGQEVAFTPLFLDTTGKNPEFVYREGGQEKRVSLNHTSIEGEIPRTLIDAINSGDPAKRAEALSTVESAIAGMITQVDSVSTRQQRAAELAEQRPSRVSSSEHAEMLGELVKLDGLKARHTVEVAEAHIADARAAREQVQEPSRVDVDKKVETPTDRAVVEFEGGQLKVGDPNRPETMKPLDDTMQRRVEEHFKRAKEQTEKEYEKSKKEAEKIGPDEERNAKLKEVEQKRDDLLKKIQTDETRYRTEPEFRKLMDAKFESTAKKMVGKIGKGAITAGGVALSFFIVANYAFGHSPDIPVEADALPPAKDLRRENRRALEEELIKTGGEKEQSSVLPPLPGQARMEDSLAAISDKLPFNASLRKELETALKDPEKFLKGEDQKKLRAALADALNKGLVRSPLKEELKEVLKEGKITPTSLGVMRDELSRGMFDPKLISKHLEAEKAQAQAKPKFDNQGQVEDLLAADRRLLRLPFDPALRRQLEASFLEARRLDLDHLRDKLYIATNNLQVRPELRELLTQYLDGGITAEDLAKLQAEVKKGLFKTELIEKALEAKNRPGSDDLLRANLQHTLKGFLPVLRAGLIEDDLADIVKRSPEVAEKLPFKPALRKELSQELSKQLKELGVKDDVIKLVESSQLESAFRKMTQEDLEKLSKSQIKLPDEIIREIKDGLSKDQFRPEYRELLEKLAKGELSAFDALSLEAAIGLRSKSSGLFKPDLVKSMLDKEMETKTWGPVSQAAYANMVRYAEADANVHYRFLGKEQLRYLPADGPIKIPPGMSFEQFQQELASGQRRVKLDLNLDNPPTRKDMEKIYATLNWNSEAKK
ncbi:MAG: hypothetical protein K2X93_04770, partial [Candidatus Obscuribacterales bacterium]|nr:hypothetical protein [Candidatus Obscuribacterales bacterium]